LLYAQGATAQFPDPIYTGVMARSPTNWAGARVLLGIQLRGGIDSGRSEYPKRSLNLNPSRCLAFETLYFFFGNGSYACL
jgi:hypothetical protein